MKDAIKAGESASKRRRANLLRTGEEREWEWECERDGSAPACWASSSVAALQGKRSDGGRERGSKELKECGREGGREGQEGDLWDMQEIWSSERGQAPFTVSKVASNPSPLSKEGLYRKS